tara:strand:+ start:12968 stop:13255 length:288 start_codon:yes stop_codon:yes gene_type:complete
MDKSQIIARIDYLKDCLAWSLQHNKILTDTQRICLNQERAAWHKELTHMQLNDTSTGTARYTIPRHLEKNLLQIVLQIDQTKWKREDYELQFKPL